MTSKKTELPYFYSQISLFGRTLVLVGGVGVLGSGVGDGPDHEQRVEELELPLGGAVPHEDKVDDTRPHLGTTLWFQS